MIRISVDDQISEYPTESTKRLGEFLEEMVSTLPPNRIVTKITLDGQPYSQPNSRSALDQTFDEIKDIQIRTADKAIWAATGLDIALSCIERVQQSLIRAAELFRESDRATANRFFVQCIDGLERFLEAITITRCALNLDFSKVFVENQSLLQVEETLSRILKSVLELQEQEDFVGIADKVEYELITNLYTWASALRKLRVSANSNA